MTLDWRSGGKGLASSSSPQTVDSQLSSELKSSLVQLVASGVYT